MIIYLSLFGNDFGGCILNSVTLSSRILLEFSMGTALGLSL